MSRSATPSSGLGKGRASPRRRSAENNISPRGKQQSASSPRRTPVDLEKALSLNIPKAQLPLPAELTSMDVSRPRRPLSGSSKGPKLPREVSETLKLYVEAAQNLAQSLLSSNLNSYSSDASRQGTTPQPLAGNASSRPHSARGSSQHLPNRSTSSYVSNEVAQQFLDSAVNRICDLSPLLAASGRTTPVDEISTPPVSARYGKSISDHAGQVVKDLFTFQQQGARVASVLDTQVSNTEFSGPNVSMTGLPPLAVVPSEPHRRSVDGPIGGELNTSGTPFGVGGAATGTSATAQADRAPSSPQFSSNPDSPMPQNEKPVVVPSTSTPAPSSNTFPSASEARFVAVSDDGRCIVDRRDQLFIRLWVCGANLASRVGKTDPLLPVSRPVSAESTDSSKPMTPISAVTIAHTGRVCGRMFQNLFNLLSHAKIALLLPPSIGVPWCVSLVYRGVFITICSLPPLFNAQQCTPWNDQVCNWIRMFGLGDPRGRPLLYGAYDGRMYLIPQPIYTALPMADEEVWQAGGTNSKLAPYCASLRVEGLFVDELERMQEEEAIGVGPQKASSNVSSHTDGRAVSERPLSAASQRQKSASGGSESDATGDNNNAVLKSRIQHQFNNAFYTRLIPSLLDVDQSAIVTTDEYVEQLIHNSGIRMSSLGAVRQLVRNLIDREHSSSSFEGGLTGEQSNAPPTSSSSGNFSKGLATVYDVAKTPKQRLVSLLRKLDNQIWARTVKSKILRQMHAFELKLNKQLKSAGRGFSGFYSDGELSGLLQLVHGELRILSKRNEPALVEKVLVPVAETKFFSNWLYYEQMTAIAKLTQVAAAAAVAPTTTTMTFTSSSSTPMKCISGRRTSLTLEFKKSLQQPQQDTDPTVPPPLAPHKMITFGGTIEHPLDVDALPKMSQLVLKHCAQRLGLQLPDGGRKVVEFSSEPVILNQSLRTVPFRGYSPAIHSLLRVALSTFSSEKRSADSPQEIALAMMCLCVSLHAFRVFTSETSFVPQVLSTFRGWVENALFTTFRKSYRIPMLASASLLSLPAVQLITRKVQPMSITTGKPVDAPMEGKSANDLQRKLREERTFLNSILSWVLPSVESGNTMLVDREDQHLSGPSRRSSVVLRRGSSSDGGSNPDAPTAEFGALAYLLICRRLFVMYREHEFQEYLAAVGSEPLGRPTAHSAVVRPDTAHPVEGDFTPKRPFLVSSSSAQPESVLPSKTLPSSTGAATMSSSLTTSQGKPRRERSYSAFDTSAYLSKDLVLARKQIRHVFLILWAKSIVASVFYRDLVDAELIVISKSSAVPTTHQRPSISGLPPSPLPQALVVAESDKPQNILAPTPGRGTDNTRNVSPVEDRDDILTPFSASIPVHQAALFMMEASGYLSEEVSSNRHAASDHAAQIDPSTSFTSPECFALLLGATIASAISLESKQKLGLDVDSHESVEDSTLRSVMKNPMQCVFDLMEMGYDAALLTPEKLSPEVQRFLCVICMSAVKYFQFCVCVEQVTTTHDDILCVFLCGWLSSLAARCSGTIGVRSDVEGMLVHQLEQSYRMALARIHVTRLESGHSVAAGFSVLRNIAHDLLVPFFPLYMAQSTDQPLDSNHHPHWAGLMLVSKAYLRSKPELEESVCRAVAWFQCQSLYLELTAKISVAAAFQEWESAYVELGTSVFLELAIKEPQEFLFLQETWTKLTGTLSLIAQRSPTSFVTLNLQKCLCTIFEKMLAFGTCGKDQVPSNPRHFLFILLLSYLSLWESNDELTTVINLVVPMFRAPISAEHRDDDRDTILINNQWLSGEGLGYIVLFLASLQSSRMKVYDRQQSRGEVRATPAISHAAKQEFRRAQKNQMIFETNDVIHAYLDAHGNIKARVLFALEAVLPPTLLLKRVPKRGESTENTTSPTKEVVSPHNRNSMSDGSIRRLSTTMPVTRSPQQQHSPLFKTGSDENVDALLKTDRLFTTHPAHVEMVHKIFDRTRLEQEIHRVAFSMDFSKVEAQEASSRLHISHEEQRGRGDIGIIEHAGQLFHHAAVSATRLYYLKLFFYDVLTPQIQQCAIGTLEKKEGAVRLLFYDAEEMARLMGLENVSRNVIIADEVRTRKLDFFWSYTIPREPWAARLRRIQSEEEEIVRNTKIGKTSLSYAVLTNRAPAGGLAARTVIERDLEQMAVQGADTYRPSYYPSHTPPNPQQRSAQGLRLRPTSASVIRKAREPLDVREGEQLKCNQETTTDGGSNDRVLDDTAKESMLRIPRSTTTGGTTPPAPPPCSSTLDNSTSTERKVCGATEEIPPMMHGRYSAMLLGQSSSIAPSVKEGTDASIPSHQIPDEMFFPQRSSKPLSRLPFAYSQSKMDQLLKTLKRPLSAAVSRQPSTDRSNGTGTDSSFPLAPQRVLGGRSTLVKDNESKQSAANEMEFEEPQSSTMAIIFGLREMKAREKVQSAEEEELRDAIFEGSFQKLLPMSIRSIYMTSVGTVSGYRPSSALLSRAVSRLRQQVASSTDL